MRKGVPGSSRSKAPQDDFAAMHEVVVGRYQRMLPTVVHFRISWSSTAAKGSSSAAYEGCARSVSNGSWRSDWQKRGTGPSRAIASRAALPENRGSALQRIRDEAHQFAVTHRNRARRGLGLDQIAGKGARRRRRSCSPRSDRSPGCDAPAARNWPTWSVRRPPMPCSATSPRDIVFCR